MYPNPLVPSLMRAPGAPDDIPESIEDWLRSPAWHAQALCRATGTDAFIRGPKDRYEAAKAVCAGCEVRQECLEYALEDKDLTGCWGGTDDRERREMRRRAAA